MTQTTTIQAATAGARTVRAPRGTKITCKSWITEAALRMIMNNLDPVPCPEEAKNMDQKYVRLNVSQRARRIALESARCRS